MTDTTKVEVAADLELGNTGWELVAEVASGSKFDFTLKPNDSVQLQDVVNALYRRFTNEDALFDTPTFPAIGLKQLTLSYEDTPSEGVSSSMKFQTVLELGQPSDKPLIEQLGFLFAKLEPKRDAGQSSYLAGIRSQGSISLVSKDAGVIGQLLGDVALEKLGLYYASQKIEGFKFADAEKAWNVPSGLSVSLSLKLRESYVDISLSSAGLELSPSGAAAVPVPPSQPAPPSPRQPAKPPKAKLEGGTRYWKDLNKTLGPLQLRRIGGEWIAGEGRLGILLDAAISLAGLTVGLSGLSVNVKPEKLTSLSFEDLGFGLDGLELAFQRGPVSISGALLKRTEKGRTVYTGAASIRAATFTIAAIGSYGTIEDQPSFFIFGAFAGIIGGPPCFVVEGIAAGFGYNRALEVPRIEDVRAFPMVSLVLGQSEGDSDSLLDRIASSFPSVRGQYWVAAGVKFTSFKLVSGFVLATVQFGTRFEIALLGIATLRQPPPPVETSFVVVEMALKVSFAPDDGVLSAEAMLTTNSFLFHQSCKLTGGFAFYIWFTPTNAALDRKQDRAGDFVLTLGGYHPKFTIPAHYPRVPRIGFNWSLPEAGVTIKGEAYFALTPSFIMAGGRLSAVFQSGAFRAWFEAYADFLMGWAPFHYTADVGVRIGASYTFWFVDIACTLSFEIGAQLSLWGPPFAGEAYLSLGIVAFTIPIGDRNASRIAEPLSWPGFETQFVPRDDKTKAFAPVRIMVVSGLTNAGKAGEDVIVNPAELCLSVESFIPITEPVVLRGKGQLPEPNWNKALGVRPMDLKDFTSKFEVSIERDGKPVEASEFVYEPVTKNLPEALWRKTPIEAARGPAGSIESKVIEDCLVEIRILPEKPRNGAATDFDLTVIPIPKTVGNLPPWAPNHVDSEETRPESVVRAEMRNILRSVTSLAAQKSALEGMRASGFGFPGFSDSVTDPGQADALVAMPLFIPMGKLPPEAMYG